MRAEVVSRTARRATEHRFAWLRWPDEVHHRSQERT
jgi:hypothetical protein